MTSGEMNVVRSGFMCHKVGLHMIYERFYLAEHLSSVFIDPQIKKALKGHPIVDNEGSVGSDSGAYVMTEDGKLHSFLINSYVIVQFIA